MRPSERGKGEGAGVREGLRERGLLQGNEHLDVRGVRQRGECQAEQSADDETPSQAEIVL